MGRKCCVPNCKSGYHKNEEKVSLFAIPKNNLQEYNRAIPGKDRVLTERDHVCEKHFKPECIIRELKTDCYKIPLKIPKLQKGSVPTIFSNFPKNISKNLPQKRRKKKRPNNTEARCIEINAEVKEDGNSDTGPSSHISSTKPTVITAPKSQQKTRLKSDVKLKCGACGNFGHIRTNKACPLYQYSGSNTPMTVVMTEELNTNDENIDNVDGMKHAEDTITKSVDRLEENNETYMRLEKAVDPLLIDNDQVALTIILDSVINKLKAMSESSPFLKPIDKKLVNNYYNIVQCPMDLETVSKRISAHEYHSRHQFVVDIEQILENCILYNGRSSPFTEKAEHLVKICKATLDEYEEQLTTLENNSFLAQDQAMQDDDQASTKGDEEKPKTKKDEAVIIEKDLQFFKVESQPLNEFEDNKIPVEGLSAYYLTNEEANLLCKEESLDVDPNSDPSDFLKTELPMPKDEIKIEDTVLQPQDIKIKIQDDVADIESDDETHSML